eukprot:TRINITY_DN6672_c0_g3_i2.p1 TRINITY_DN6672_c0_g3~~TRINITY_DN6672_c0_g3_i2.p1  ORF type:complete len:287 (+),score=49.09 TRINITY_DN6672_c0_g3_i2:87-947(+)
MEDLSADEIFAVALEFIDRFHKRSTRKDPITSKSVAPIQHNQHRKADETSQYRLHIHPIRINSNEAVNKDASGDGIIILDNHPIGQPSQHVALQTSMSSESNMSEEQQQQQLNHMLRIYDAYPKDETIPPPPLPQILPEVDNHGLTPHHSTGRLTDLLSLEILELIRSSPDNCNVFVRNLPSKMNAASFQSLMGSFGTLVKCNLMLDAMQKACRGFGFAIYQQHVSAKNAILCINILQVSGRRIKAGWGQDYCPPSDECLYLLFVDCMYNLCRKVKQIAPGLDGLI